MKKVIWLAAFMTFHMLSFAQEIGDRRNKQGVKWMKELSLSESQQQQMKALREEKRKKLEALDKEDNIMMKEYRLRKATIQNESKSQLRAILSPEQKQKLENIKKDRKQKADIRLKERREQMRRELSLTDDQFEKMTKIQEKTAANAKSIRENQTLTLEQKRQEIRKIRADQRNETVAFLDASQASKWKELKKQQKGKKQQ